MEGKIYHTLVENPITGIRALVYFSSVIKGALTADGFSAILNVISQFSMSINGTKDFTNKHSRITGVVITRTKLGPIPKEKSEIINNLEFINEKDILISPYDNVMQSQFKEMSVDEEKVFYSDPSITKKQIPSMKKNGDAYFNYANFKNSSTLEIDREEFGEQVLNQTVSYRLVK